MSANSSSKHCSQRLGSAQLASSRALNCLFLLALLLATNSLYGENTGQSSLGIAWQVRGDWRIAGKGAPLSTGEAIQPGSLLQPGPVPRDGEADNHSITVLLPDGQRILYECFTMEDCARGFRVPSLNRTPEPFAVDLLARVRAELIRDRRSESLPPTKHSQPSLARDEVVSVLDPGNRANVAGLASDLPDGRYTYDLRPLDRAYPAQFHLTLEKSARSVAIALPSPGLYDITITDDLNTPRIDLFVAAIKPAQEASFMKSFQQAKALLKLWDDNYFGWPSHDFQRAYLESLMNHVSAPATQIDAAATSASTMGDQRGQSGNGDAAGESRRTAEPSFLPKPGLLEGDTAITLRCDTPGATLHYTVDGSEPVASSPVYGGPIMVQGTGLTIKSFARAAGKRDSAVVTGIFRIRQ